MCDMLMGMHIHYSHIRLVASLQILAHGLIFGKQAYLKSGWNVLDIVVVIIGLIDLVPSLRGLNLTALRALRVLRPLRAIKRIEALKLCLETLMQVPRAITRRGGLPCVWLVTCCWLFIAWY